MAKMTDKVVLVIGGASGIGATIADRLATEFGATHRVIVDSSRASQFGKRFQ